MRSTWLLACSSLAVFCCRAPGQVPSAAQVASELGLDRNRVAAAGVGSAGALSLLQRLHDDVGSRESLHAAKNLAESRLRALQEAKQQLGIDPTSVQARQLVRARHGELAAAQSQVHQAQQSLEQTALNGLPEQVVTRLRTLARSRGEGGRIELGVVVREPSQWTRLSSALAAERRALSTGEPLAAETATLLATVRSHPEVVAAGVALESNLAGVSTAFAAFGPG